MNSKALQRPQQTQSVEKLSYEEYSTPNGYLSVWEDGNWVIRHEVNTKTGVSKTTKTLKERPRKPVKIEYREF